MRGGFSYTPPRPIQYGRIDPYEKLASGIASGMSMGAKYKQMKGSEGAEVPVADLTPFSSNQAFPGTIKSLNEYDDHYDSLTDYKKSVKDKVDKKSTTNIYKAGVVIQDPLVDTFFKNEVEPKFVKQFMENVDGPQSAAWMTAMDAKITTPEGKKVWATYKKGYINAKTKHVAKQIMDSKKGLLVYDKYANDPKKYQGTKGAKHESMAKVVKQVNPMMDVIRKSAESGNKVDAKWLSDYLKGSLPEQQRGRAKGRGFKPESKLGYIKHLEKTDLLTSLMYPNRATLTRKMAAYLKTTPSPYMQPENYAYFKKLLKAAKKDKAPTSKQRKAQSKKNKMMNQLEGQ